MGGHGTEDHGAHAPPIRVLIVEDHTMVAEGLVAMMAEEPDLEVVGVAATVAAAVVLLGQTAPDVVLADFRLPDGDGSEVATAVTDSATAARTVILTAADGAGVAARAIDCGASGFVHKRDSVAEMVSAIRTVAAGDVWFRPEILTDVVQRLRGADPHLGEDLTSREREVLDLLSQGASTETMVTTLVLSPHTVRNHVRNVMGKLGAHSKLQAVTIAAAAGLVQLGDPG